MAEGYSGPSGQPALHEGSRGTFCRARAARLTSAASEQAALAAPESSPLGSRCTWKTVPPPPHTYTHTRARGIQAHPGLPYLHWPHLREPTASGVGRAKCRMACKGGGDCSTARTSDCARMAAPPPTLPLPESKIAARRWWGAPRSMHQVPHKPHAWPGSPPGRLLNLLQLRVCFSGGGGGCFTNPSRHLEGQNISLASLP